MFKYCDGVILEIVRDNKLSILIGGHHGPKFGGEPENFARVVQHLLDVLLGLLGRQREAVLERVVEAAHGEAGVRGNRRRYVGRRKFVNSDGIYVLLSLDFPNEWQNVDK